jgi:aspartate/methionine/tyrosine aminotransferase
MARAIVMEPSVVIIRARIPVAIVISIIVTVVITIIIAVIVTATIAPSTTAEAAAATPFDPLPCAGTYFQLARYDCISPLPDREFAAWLTREIGVATIPLSAFHHDGHDQRVVRFCFAKRDETLEAAAEKLRRL